MKYKDQIKIIKQLANNLREICNKPQNDIKRKNWANHNELAGNTDTLLWVCVDDDGGWQELIPNASIETQDEELRKLEFKLRKDIYHYYNFHDDFVFEPVVRFDIPGEYTGYMYGDALQKSAWGVDICGEGIGNTAYHLKNYLNDKKNIEKMLSHEVDFIVDHKELARLKNKYEEAVDGIIKVEFIVPYTVLVQSLLIEFVHLRGLEEMMFDLYDNPDMIDKVMGHMANSKAKLLDKLEKENLLYDNRTNVYTGSGGLGYTNQKSSGSLLISNMWGFADAQEFSNVSNKMFERFALKYQNIGLSKFGMACYGCCEPLDGKYEMIFDTIKNIRRLSVSPWADVNEAAQSIQDKAILSYKPNPAKICVDFDDYEIEKMLKSFADITKGCTTEIILKDIRTCAGTNKNIKRFIEIVNNTVK